MRRGTALGKKTGDPLPSHYVENSRKYFYVISGALLHIHVRPKLFSMYVIHFCMVVRLFEGNEDYVACSKLRLHASAHTVIWCSFPGKGTDLSEGKQSFFPQCNDLLRRKTKFLVCK